MLRPLLAIAALGLLAMPANATAKPGHVVFPASKTIEANLPASNGYRLQISADTREGVIVQAYKRQSIVSYWVKSATVDEGLIKARLPGVGRVALRFHPDGPPDQRPPFCKGRPDRVEKGVFVGAIRFRGERGFTEATATRVRGRITTSFRQVCSDDSTGSAFSDDVRWTTLSATSKRTPKTYAGFSISRLETSFGDDDIWLTGFTGSDNRGMVVYRIVSVPGGTGLFDVPDPKRLGSATVTAKAPFSGSATYRAEGNRTASWVGTLSAEFPGLGEVTLAGPKFSAGLCLNEDCSGEASRSNGSLIVAGRPW